MKRLAIAVIACMFLIAPVPLLAQEHPEHPTDKPVSQEPGLTKDGLADAAQTWVQHQTAMQGGYFLVYDPVAKAPLVLTLDKVHRDRVSRLGDNEYFVCADFKATNGKTYDIDVFMTQGEDGGLQATDLGIHKVDGTPRYTWSEEDGVWKKKKA